MCDRGYYDKDEFIRTQPVDEDIKGEDINKYSVIDNNFTSQITMNINSHYHLTQCNAVLKSSHPNVSTHQIISDEQIE